MSVNELASRLKSGGKTLSIAESCTGGLVAKLLTDVPGSSAYFKEGVVAYADESKTRLLGVPAQVIDRHGAVSEQVAVAMALGSRVRSGADIAVSITGIAGPSGGTREKPVGTVFVGVADASGCRSYAMNLDPQWSRQEIRERAARDALEILQRGLQEDSL